MSKIVLYGHRLKDTAKMSCQNPQTLGGSPTGGADRKSHLFKGHTVSAGMASHLFRGYIVSAWIGGLFWIGGDCVCGCVWGSRNRFVVECLGEPQQVCREQQ